MHLHYISKSHQLEPSNLCPNSQRSFAAPDRQSWIHSPGSSSNSGHYVIANRDSNSIEFNCVHLSCKEKEIEKLSLSDSICTRPASSHEPEPQRELSSNYHLQIGPHAWQMAPASWSSHHSQSNYLIPPSQRSCCLMTQLSPSMGAFPQPAL